MANAVVESFKTQLTREAELRLSDSFPERLRVTNELLKSELFDSEANRKKLQEECAVTSPSDTPAVSNQSMPRSVAQITSNSLVEEAYNAVKPLLLQLGEDTQLLRMWVTMNVPKIDDGNNFGVAVQEEMIMEASRTEADITTMLDFYCDYLAYRGKVCTKKLKWPGIADYGRMISDLDETTYIRLRMALQDIRNNYARLYQLFTSNIGKIRNPRSDPMEAVNVMY